MDRLKHLRSEAGGSGDSTLDTTSPPSEAYMTVNDSSKYFSLSDSTFDTSPVKDVSLASTSASEPNPTVAHPDELMSSLSPIRNNDMLDTYKIGSQIEAANILSGGVDIFDDNDNSFDGDELVIDDNSESDKICADKAEIGPSGHIAGLEPPVIETEITTDCSDIKELEANVVGDVNVACREIDESELPAVQAESIVARPKTEDPEPSAVVGEVNVASREIDKAELPAVQAESIVARPKTEDPEPSAVVGEDNVASREIDKAELPTVQAESSVVSRAIEDPEPSVVIGEVSVASSEIVEPHEGLNAIKKKMKEPEPQLIDEDMNGVNREIELAEGPFEVEEIHVDGRDVEELEAPVVEEEVNVADQEMEELEPPVVMGEVNIASREMEVVLQIDGNNVNAIDIGNGLYLYRRDGEQELAAIQIFGDDPHCNVKYLKVRDNAQGNLEVYEEIEVEVPKELPVAEKKPVDKNTPVPTNSHKEMSNSATNKNTDKKHESPQNEPVASTSKCYQAVEDKETTAEPKSEVNRSGKMMKFCESRKSPLVGSLTPMPFHSTPIKEGKPLTKTMVDLQLHPNRHSDIVKKTIEVHTDNNKPKSTESIVKISTESIKTVDNISTPIEIIGNKLKHTENKIKIMMPEKNKNVCMTSTYRSIKPASTIEANETKDSHTGKSENQALDIKSVECKHEPDNSKINLVKDTIISKLVVDENVKKEREDNSKPSTTVVLPASSKNTNDRTISTLEESKQIENDKDKSVTDKKQLVLDKEDIQQEKDTAKNTTISESNIVETLTGGKVVENSTLKQSVLTTTLPQSPLEAKVDSSLLNKDNNVVPEKASEVTNKSINHRGDKLKVDGMKINVFESLNSITASSTAKIKTTENKESDYANDFVTKMSNVVSHEQNNKILVHTIKESNVEGRSDSRRNFANEENCLSTCAETPKGVNKSNSQKHNNTEEIKIEKSIPVPNVNLVVKTSTPIAVVSETLCVPSGKEAHPSPVFEIKSCHKDKCILPEREIKSSGVNPLEKLAKSSESYSKPLEKTAQGHIIDLKSPEKVAQPIVVSDVKPTVKAVHSIPASKGKLSEKATSTAILIVKDQEPCSDKINETGKHIGHIPVVANIASKPNPKIIPIKILKSEDIKKSEMKEVVTKNNVVDNTSSQIKTESREVKEPISQIVSEPRPVNNNHTAAVPFGKWTDKNRQDFLNKFKGVKAPIHTNTKQIKNSNDLNRRDVLKKIDSQRAQTIINNATAKAQEKLNVKNEIVFSSKVHPKVEPKIPVNKECVDVKPILPHSKVPTKQENPHVASVSSKVITKQNKPNKAAVTSSVPTSFATVETDATDSKTESAPRIGLSTATMANLIDKTIEGMINRVVPSKSTVDEPKESMKVNVHVPNSADQISVVQQITEVAVIDASGTLDDIEMKMNELHGIPFVERPPHELPKVIKPEIKTCNKTEKDKPVSKVTKIPDVSSTSERQVVTDNTLDIDSEEEVIEHEPITGDIEINKKAMSNNLLVQERKPRSDKSVGSVFSKDASNKGTIITETDFDKFARRNSITYEDCLTVNFEHKEAHNVVQTVKEKDLAPKNNESIRIDVKSKLPHKLVSRHNAHSGIGQGTTKFGAVSEDSSNKNYHSKIHSAYQSLTAKHQTSAITIIEDKPVKVVFVESNTGFVPSQLNVQGQELSPSKQLAIEVDVGTTMNTESVDSDMLEIIDENKPQDKVKAKHQRKQVLTPVEEPELELIQPSDIGINVTPKKKRKTDDSKLDKQTKNLVHKKSYLLGRNTIMEDKTTKTQLSNTPKEILNWTVSAIEHKDTASAIDSLVKAAELLENQTENVINDKNITLSPNSPTNTPAKRGRGRPRKYPLPEEATNNKTPSPQKKPRLIDTESVNQDSISDDHDGDTSEDEIIRENWTMGKINENIVCPICSKLFRSENVVFKHVKHCTGVSPSRSESDKQSPHRVRLSQESESISDMDYETPLTEIEKSPTKRRKCKDSSIAEGNAEIIKPEGDKDDVIVIEDLPIKEMTTPKVDKEDVIVIEDTPMKEKPDKHDKEKEKPTNSVKSKVIHQTNNLVCEFCGKKFRQLSHLVSHKVQHKKEQAKKVGKDVQNSNKLQVFSCNFCKKEFRKLHHLVQHRIIHSPNTVPKRTLRNSSLDQSETKHVKEEATVKRNEDPSTGFRCEPCDKSFRKLHHLVEHRETHDCINRQKPTAASQPVEPPQCEKNKKTFRKLQHLIEHKEQHAESSSDKSDEKSVKSALSTKDIIHECSLCYMVFPNEHSLNKHSIICSRKKRKSKQPKEHSEKESVNEDEKSKADDETDVILIPQTVAQGPINNGEELIKEHEIDVAKKSTEIEKVSILKEPSITEIKQSNDDKIALSDVTDKAMRKAIEIKPTETQIASIKQEVAKSDENNVVETSVVTEKVKKINHKEVKIQDTPKKRTPLKDKVVSTGAKRQKTNNAQVAAVDEVKLSVESSDEDEVRYMLNPNFKASETSEEKIFMKVRAIKRNSLQIERPNSRDLSKRRSSMQNPPKIPRLKPEALERKPKVAELKPKALDSKRKSAEPKIKIESESTSVSQPTLKHLPKLSQTEANSTDSDDSDVKYSFPKNNSEVSNSLQGQTSKPAKKIPRKSLLEKRKTLGTIAKRKSLGKAVTTKHTVKDSPVKLIKKRTTEVEHRCDCGQLFSSAALLSRHTSLAHTPPRIRRRRDPSPALPPAQPSRAKPVTATAQPAPAKNSSVKTKASDTKPKPSIATRKSSVRTETTTPAVTRKSVSTSQPKPSTTTTRRSTAHAGVPVPEKMRKVMERNKK